MVLDVAVPDPPQLSNRGMPSEFEALETVGGAADLRREELEEILRDGAWQEAFDEWAEYTDLSEEEFRIARDLGLVERIDVFWDPSEKRLRSTAPGVPDDWEAHTEATPTDGATFPETLESELSDLGRVVVEMIEDAYVDWREGEETEDPVWSEETFGHGVQE